MRERKMADDYRKNLQGTDKNTRHNWNDNSYFRRMEPEYKSYINRVRKLYNSLHAKYI